MKLADNVVEAMSLMNEIDRITEDMPGLDCGACGAPTCKALAEDIVRGVAKESDCIFKLREKINSFAQQFNKFEGYLSQTPSRLKEDDSKGKESSQNDS